MIGQQITLESARAELRAARAAYRACYVREDWASWWRVDDAHAAALRRYRYARCVDLEYALRLKARGIDPAGLGGGS